MNAWLEAPPWLIGFALTFGAWTILVGIALLGYRDAFFFGAGAYVAGGFWYLVAMDEHDQRRMDREGRATQAARTADNG